MPRVLITRSPHQASALAELLRASGLEPILIPTIELAPPTTFAPLDSALAHLDHFHWLLFTSANAVEAFHQRLTHLNSVILSEGGAAAESKSLSRASRGIPEAARQTATLKPFSTTSSSTPYSLLLTHCSIAAIGPATARALQAIGLTPTLIPPQAVAESLAAALLPHAPPGTRFLLIRAEQARDILPDTLTAAGAEITIAPAYRTVIPQESIPAIRALFAEPANYPAAITFTSSSTATNLLALLDSAGLTLPPEILRISIGPVTSQTLRSLGLPPHAEAAEPTIPALAEKVVKTLKQGNFS
jgi:uroporphyrinogen-III synthase